MERLYLCKAIIEEPTEKIYKEKHGEEISPANQERMPKAFLCGMLMNLRIQQHDL